MPAAKRRAPLRVLAFVLAFGIGFSLSAAASASVDQEGRKAANTQVDGAAIILSGESFYAPGGGCVLYGMLVTTSSRHVEGGVLRCPTGVVIGDCTNDRAFLERYAGGTYVCVPGSNFNNGDWFSLIIKRSASPTTTMTGSIAGAQIAQSGFSHSAVTETLAWGEVTGGPSCPTGPAKGHFQDWQKLINGVWTHITSAPIYSYHSGISAAPCWNTITQLHSNSDFDVLP